MFVKCNNLIIFCVKSHFHTTTFLYNVKSRQIRNNLKKLMATSSKKKYYVDANIPIMPSPRDIAQGSIGGKPSGGSARRIHVLNKLFMKYVTDLMATGEYSSQILGHGVEIDRVKITSDYKILNIFWHTKHGSSKEDAVENILQKNAGYLRHELSQLRLMGNVPTIKFVRDKFHSSLVDIDKKLSEADFGDDHVPIDSVTKLKTELQMILPLDDDVKEKLQELDKENVESGERPELPLPPMTHNVFGLNHADILTRVKRSMKKSEALHRLNNRDETKSDWASFKVNQEINENPISLGVGKTQHETFKEFLRKRQILQQKLDKEKYCDPNWEYMKQEKWERRMREMENYQSEENTEEDYVFEDFDESNHKS